tara:strand:- start:14223 stop:14894 length:672 start_codon:yes stop_codon:yes gene_type:complete
MNAEFIKPEISRENREGELISEIRRRLLDARYFVQRERSPDATTTPAVLLNLFEKHLLNMEVSLTAAETRIHGYGSMRRRDASGTSFQVDRAGDLVMERVSATGRVYRHRAHRELLQVCVNEFATGEQMEALLDARAFANKRGGNGFLKGVGDRIAGVAHAYGIFPKRYELDVLTCWLRTLVLDGRGFGPHLDEADPSTLPQQCSVTQEPSEEHESEVSDDQA